MKKMIIIFSLVFMQEEYIVTIDATSYSDWVYYSFLSHQVLDCNNEGTLCSGDYDWDIAFQRKHMRTNSGLAGSGNGGAYVDSSMVWTQEWSSTNELPNNIDWIEDSMMNDIYDLSTHTFVEGVKNPALNSWGWFDETYTLNPTHYTMFVKCANGQDIVKFWAYDYYLNRVGGVISMRYETGYGGCVPDGNINQDNSINVLDLVTIVQTITNDLIFNEQDLCNADMNQDNYIDILDIVLIIQILLGS